MAERRRDTEWSHPPLEPCALALLQEGSWYGLAQTGYKLLRRVSQKQKGSALDLRNRNFNGKRRIKNNVQRSYICQRNGRDTIVARHALSPSTPRAFRRDPPGSRGLTAQRGQARRPAVPINAKLRLREPLSKRKGRKC